MTSFFQERAILDPKLKDVDSINDYMLSLMSGEEKVYFSSDSIYQTDATVDSIDNLYTSKVLNSVRLSSLHNHELKLKVKAPDMGRGSAPVPQWRWSLQLPLLIDKF